jgi:hypothetical protein
LPVAPPVHFLASLLRAAAVPVVRLADAAQKMIGYALISYALRTRSLR